MPSPITPSCVHRIPSDDKAFVAQVEATCRGIKLLYRPDGLRVVHVDNWFGPKWLGFSGKILGALGVWKDIENPTLPPFVPNRVIAEQLWSRDAEGRYQSSPVTSDLHVAQAGSANTQRLAARIAPGFALLWFSANTVTNRRGAMMAYVPSGNTYLAWYVGLGADVDWSAIETKGITQREFEKLLSSDVANEDV